ACTAPRAAALPRSCSPFTAFHVRAAAAEAAAAALTAQFVAAAPLELATAAALELMATHIASLMTLELTPAELPVVAMRSPAVPTHAPAPADSAAPRVAAPVKTRAVPTVVIPAVSPAVPNEHLHVLDRIHMAGSGPH